MHGSPDPFALVISQASVLNDYLDGLRLKVGPSLRETLPSASTGFATTGSVLGFLTDFVQLFELLHPNENRCHELR